MLNGLGVLDGVEDDELDVVVVPGCGAGIGSCGWLGGGVDACVGGGGGAL